MLWNNLSFLGAFHIRDDCDECCCQNILTSAIGTAEGKYDFWYKRSDNKDATKYKSLWDNIRKQCHSWWRHQMETFSALLALCAGNSPVPVNSPHKGQWRGALMLSFICVWINDWVNNREAGDLRCHRGHYDVNVMYWRCVQILGGRHPWMPPISCTIPFMNAHMVHCLKLMSSQILSMEAYYHILQLFLLMDFITAR